MRFGIFSVRTLSRYVDRLALDMNLYNFVNVLATASK